MERDPIKPAHPKWRKAVLVLEPAEPALDGGAAPAVIVPGYALLGGFAAALGIGALAGLYPAVRAARMSPKEALRTV